MATYPRLAMLMRQGSAATTIGFANTVVPYLVSVWLGEYGQSTQRYDVVEVTLDGFSYLFDIANERLIAAWGISTGRDPGPRSDIATRMKGHPKGGGKRYHRGHAIAHTLGGGTDINLVPQLGSINTGRFRSLEIEAVKIPGAFYFTYWNYQGSQIQRPVGVDQGLLLPGRSPEIRHFPN